MTEPLTDGTLAPRNLGKEAEADWLKGQWLNGRPAPTPQGRGSRMSRSFTRERDEFEVEPNFAHQSFYASHGSSSDRSREEGGGGRSLDLLPNAPLGVLVRRAPVEEVLPRRVRLLGRDDPSGTLRLCGACERPAQEAANQLSVHAEFGRQLFGPNGLGGHCVTPFRSFVHAVRVAAAFVRVKRVRFDWLGRTSTCDVRCQARSFDSPSTDRSPCQENTRSMGFGVLPPPGYPCGPK